MRRLRFCIGAILAVLWIAPLRAQQATGTVRGRVTDAATSQPLVGVTVTVAGRGVLTVADGRYVLSGVAGSADSVRARLIGYAASARPVRVAGGDTVVVDFTLTPQAVGLSQMVVVGYGTQRAGDLTSAQSQVPAEKFNPGPIVSPQQLIQNKVAGVEVVDNNEPGGGLSIRVRGQASVNAGSEPLYVVDGVPLGTGSGAGLSAGRDPLNFLNPRDVGSITVLKDAAAAAIYGANASNGVVLITTRTGEGKTHIEYGTAMSSSSVTRLPSMLNATQFRAAVMQYAPPANQAQLANANTDWFSLVTRTAFGQSHDFSVAGAGTSNDYRLAVGYLNQDGIIRGSTAERLSLGLNYGQRVLNDQLSLRANLKGSRAFDLFTPGGVISNAAQMGPTQPVFDDTSKTGYYNWPGYNLASADNPLQILNLAKNQGTTYRSVGSIQGDYILPVLSGLKATVNLGYDAAKVTNASFDPSVLHAQVKTGGGGSAFRGDRSELNTVLTTYLNYAAPLNVLPGNVDATAGYSYSQSHGDALTINLSGLATDAFDINAFPTAQNTNPQLSVGDSKLISFFGRVNYNLNDRWLAAFSLRRDGSSRFGPGNQWGNFPALSVGWRLSQESFMRGLPSVSDLKLRASWGKTGNQAFANYLQRSTYLGCNQQGQIQFGGQFVCPFRPSSVDPNIKWESTNTYDVGLDYGLLDERITGSIDWYTKKTSDLIFTVPPPAGANLSNFVTTNIGTMKNQGFELSVSARLRERDQGLSWTADFTAAHNTNELTAINPNSSAAQQILVGGVAGGVGTTIQVLRPGVPISSFFVCRQVYAGGKPVEGKYRSLTADTVITGCPNSDRRPFHDPAPKWMLGHTSHLTYDHFDLSFTLRAWLGNYVYNNVASNLGTYAELTRASPYNLNTSVLKTGFMNPQYLSDYYVEKASFLRMDNIAFGYSFQYKGQPMRLYGVVQNAFTITGYSGVDPTAGLGGIDNNIYPRSRTVTGGLSVRF